MSATPQKKSPFLSMSPVKAAVRSLYFTNKFSADTPTLVSELLTNPENSSSPILDTKVTFWPTPSLPRHSATLRVVPPTFITILPTCEF